MFNPIKSKPIAQQKQIAEKQRQEQAVREQQLKKKIESKRELLRNQNEILIKKYEVDTAKQSQLKKEYYKDILPVDEVEHIRVVVNYRFVPCSDKMYIPYVGAIYPIGNSGVNTSGLHFTPMAIDKVVHMGFIDEEEKAFLFQKKLDLIVENDMHSSGFALKEELTLN